VPKFLFQEVILSFWGVFGQKAGFKRWSSRTAS